MFADVLDATRTFTVATLIAAAATGLAGVAHADPNGQMYGNPQAAAPYWRYQHGEDCGLMSVADVIGQLTGKEPSETAVVLRGLFTKSQAHHGDIYHFDGTSPQDLVVLLGKYGIQSDLTTGNSMQTLEQDLAGGHKVIAGSTPKPSGTIPRARVNAPTPTMPLSSPESTPEATSSISTTAARLTAATNKSPWTPSAKPGLPATTCSSLPDRPAAHNHRPSAIRAVERAPRAGPDRWGRQAVTAMRPPPPDAPQTPRSSRRCRCTTGPGIRSVRPASRQRCSASSRSRELAATPPAISNVDTPSSAAARTAFMVSTSATASWKPAAMSAVDASG
ncbi:putative tRNA threonylcarbamoyladenosine biosynthesis Gcp domain protein [Mycobacterium xenopi 4042]|uniref:Putative tRNA threonylcarbamoyladenosine biosynthesis Gcp domain protein n=1 Tax=Mycobacterium xenopi 4042 TaxID=1299334 RepID=X7YJ50_MYCXE|nr:putative tRNA threonylcarbamoyladenosine biosynthesis Gcp domain protein [Mycobacterium xenopi 4042]